jgi:hypothetical protein
LILEDTASDCRREVFDCKYSAHQQQGQHQFPRVEELQQPSQFTSLGLHGETMAFESEIAFFERYSDVAAE